MKKVKFKPRKFVARINEKCLDDFGMSGIVFETHSLKKGEIYYEQDPAYLSEPYNHNVVIDNTGSWLYIGEKDFWKKFKEINKNKIK